MLSRTRSGTPRLSLFPPTQHVEEALRLKATSPASDSTKSRSPSSDKQPKTSKDDVLNRVTELLVGAKAVGALAGDQLDFQGAETCFSEVGELIAFPGSSSLLQGEELITHICEVSEKVYVVGIAAAALHVVLKKIRQMHQTCKDLDRMVAELDRLGNILQVFCADPFDLDPNALKVAGQLITHVMRCGHWAMEFTKRSAFWRTWRSATDRDELDELEKIRDGLSRDLLMWIALRPTKMMMTQGPCQAIRNSAVRNLWIKYCGSSNESVSKHIFQWALENVLKDELTACVITSGGIAAAVSNIDSEPCDGLINVFEVDVNFPEGLAISDCVLHLKLGRGASISPSRRRGSMMLLVEDEMGVARSVERRPREQYSRGIQPTSDSTWGHSHAKGIGSENGQWRTPPSKTYPSEMSRTIAGALVQQMKMESHTAAEDAMPELPEIERAFFVPPRSVLRTFV